MFEHYYALEPKADMLITEMRNTRYRQPAWYRYVAGFSGSKPVVIAENPYGGVVPELIDLLGRGRAYDRFRMSIFEGAALGVSVTLPYGSWMGSEIEDAFYAPHELCVEINEFMAANEHLYSTTSAAEVGMVFSIESSLAQEITAREALANNRLNLISDDLAPFWDCSEALSDACLPYDVIMFPDGTLRPDTITAAELARYPVVVLPDCGILTEHQADALLGYLDQGGRLLVVGKLAENLDEARREGLRSHAGTTTFDSPRGVVARAPGRAAGDGAGGVRRSHRAPARRGRRRGAHPALRLRRGHGPGARARPGRGDDQTGRRGAVIGLGRPGWCGSRHCDRGHSNPPETAESASLQRISALVTRRSQANGFPNRRNFFTTRLYFIDSRVNMPVGRDAMTRPARGVDDPKGEVHA